MKKILVVAAIAVLLIAVKVFYDKAVIDAHLKRADALIAETEKTIWFKFFGCWG